LKIFKELSLPSVQPATAFSAFGGVWTPSRARKDCL